MKRLEVPPAPIPLSATEYLVPLHLETKRQVRRILQVLRAGETFHLKAIGPIAKDRSGRYLLFAKLKASGARHE